MWQLQMHCNLRPSDAAPVLIRFNYEAHAKLNVSQLIRCHLIPGSVFTADTLHYTVTLTFDLEHL